MRRKGSNRRKSPGDNQLFYGFSFFLSNMTCMRASPRTAAYLFGSHCMETLAVLYVLDPTPLEGPRGSRNSPR